MLRNLFLFVAFVCCLCTVFPQNIYADQNQELYDAIVNNDINKVQNLINQYVDLNMFFKPDVGLAGSPIQLALNNNNIEIFKLLVANGASLSDSLNNNTNYLCYAISHKNLELIDILLKKNIIKLNKNISSLGYYGILFEKYPFQEIEGFGFEVSESSRNEYYNNLSDFFKIFNILIENEVDVNENSTQLESPLNYLCSKMIWGKFKKDKNHIGIAEIMIKAGANVNFINSIGCTPLMYSSDCGDFELSQLLIENNANFLVKNKQGANLLRIVCDSYNNRFGSNEFEMKSRNADFPALIKYYLDLGLKTDLFRLVHVDNNSVNFYNCENNNYTDEKCINRINFSLENLSKKTIKKVTVLVTIGTPGTGTKVLYRKKHTIDIDLGPDEIIRTNDIYLNNGVNCELTEEGGLYIYSKIEVLSVN